MNKIYTCVGFTGHYPVGTMALIVAKDEASAKNLIELELRKQGLQQDVPLEKIEEIHLDKEYAEIILNGNY